MQLIRKLKRGWWQFLELGKRAKTFRDLIADSPLSRSYFPESHRKSRPKIALDLIWWLIRHREINTNYYVYGLDRIGEKVSSRMSWREFRDVRNTLISSPANLFSFYVGKYNYTCMTRDKFLFTQYLRSLNVAVPNSVALVAEGRVTLLDSGGTHALEELPELLADQEYFCKPIDGIKGQQIFVFSIRDGKLLQSEVELDSNEWRALLCSGRYLVEIPIPQHDEMRSLYPHAINTLRVVTVAAGDKPELFSLALRIGAKGNRFDNWAAGGIIIGLDPASGRCVGDGFYKPGRGLRVRHHPDTDIKLEGFQVPFVRESIGLACDAHKFFYGLHSIGWDIAITPGGPLIIEGNDDWDGAIPMTLEPDFAKRFKEKFRANATGY